MVTARAIIWQMLGKLAYYPLEVARTVMTVAGAKTLAVAADHPGWVACLGALYQKVGPGGAVRLPRVLNCPFAQSSPLGLYRGHSILRRVYAADV